MIRYCWLYLAAVLLFISVGCEKSAEPRPRARVAKAGLMPGDAPAFEPIYVENQSNVKIAPARTVSYEPLDTFREQNAARAEARLAGDRNEDTAADLEEAAEGSGGQSIAKKLTNWFKGRKKGDGKQEKEEEDDDLDDEDGDGDDDDDENDDLDDDDDDLDDDEDLDDEDDDLDDEDEDEDEDDSGDEEDE